MKNLRNQIIRRLKFEKFLKEQLWEYLLVLSFVCFCAWLFDKWIIAIMFCISHLIIRMCFEKQYHCGKTYLCLIITLTVAFFGIAYCLPLSVSLLFTIPVCFFISWIGYLAQDRIDCISTIKKLSSKTIWEMNENELAEYCYAKGIRGDMLEFVIMIIIYQMKYEEIGKKLRYSVDTLKDWAPKCKLKLGIKSWKHN